MNKEWQELAEKKYKENKKFLETLKKKSPKKLDQYMQSLHEEAFEEIDCLTCANCCKTTGPLFTQKDIDRIAQHLKLKPGKFVETYLRIDEDGDYVLQEVPCAFLGEDNYCSIYSHRPKACREYPHTDRKKFYQLAKITTKNTLVCPAVFHIVEEMKKSLPKK